MGSLTNSINVYLRGLVDVPGVVFLPSNEKNNIWDELNAPKIIPSMNRKSVDLNESLLTAYLNDFFRLDALCCLIKSVHTNRVVQKLTDTVSSGSTVAVVSTVSC